MDLDQSVKNTDALEVEVAKKIMAEAKLAADYAAQVKKNRKIVKVKKALKQELKAVKDENEEVKGSLYTLTMHCNELKEQLENSKKMERKQQLRIQRLEKEAAEGEEKHSADLMDFALKKRIEELEADQNRLKVSAAYQKQCRMDAEEDLSEAKTEIAAQKMDIENFHAVATEARAEVEKLKAANTKIADLNGTLLKESMEYDAHVDKLKAESEFAITAKDALHKQLQKTEAKLIQALDEVTEAQRERNKLRKMVSDWGVATLPSTPNTVVPGAFIRLKGTNAEGKRELWFGQIDKVNPANLSVTVGRYWEEAETKNGNFLMLPCRASAGLPLKGEWLDANAFQVLNHFPFCDESYNHSMKKSCERAGWGPFDNCDQHTAEQHAAMRMQH
jgi:hypothetical protein